MNRIIVLFLACIALVSREAQPSACAQTAGNPALHSAPKTKALGKSRTFQFGYAGVIKNLPPGQETRVWLPYPPTTAEQDVEVIARKLPADGAVHVEKRYGNRMLYFKAAADAQGTVPFEIVYQVTRREVTTNFQANVTLAARPTDSMSNFLKADKLVPVGGKSLDLLKDKTLPGNNPYAAARIMYDVVDEHMKYSKVGTGWGRGDAVWACDSKFGNCTDFHSLFISMARGNKIPSKFEMGFSIPPKRGTGAVPGYHCWAWFMPKAKSWVPVDISEANRFPGMKDYYFGNLTEDRVQFTTGRDIDLEPRQQGPALNFFIYPYAEAAGKPVPQVSIVRAFSYRDIGSSLP